MKLDCVMYSDVEFLCVTNDTDYPIKVLVKDSEKGKFKMILTKEGYCNRFFNAKCVIFPEGKTSWEGFKRPFIDGDIVATSTGEWIGIMKEEHNSNIMSVYCVLNNAGLVIYHREKAKWCFDRLATEEERQRLFNAIEKNGYEWNSEKKCLEKLVIKPKFKVGDKVRDFNYCKTFIITNVIDNYYMITEVGSTVKFPVLISNDKDWELVPDKFDINTLKRFDKVLVRNYSTDEWDIDFFGHYSRGLYHTTGKSLFRQCIPYKGHEHIVGTSVDCADFYKNWED